MDVEALTEERLATENLQTCARKWPRAVAKVEEEIGLHGAATLNGRESATADVDVSSASSRSKKTKKKGGGNRGQDAHSGEIEEEQEDVQGHSGGSKLRPALDVLNRLRHDREYDIDQFIVGYLDRFGGMREKAVSEWEADVSGEEFVPQSRIWYFKRIGGGKDEVVWDREKKVDMVFGSGSGR